jgi:hypothetical protein
MKTALDWFIEKLEEEHLIFNHGLVEVWKKQAKLAEKEQHGNTWNAALKAYDERGGVYVRAFTDFDDYYNETFETE